MTEVVLVFYEGRIEHWLRFGTQDRERILDRRRRIIAFAPGEVFAFVRWEANDYGTVLSRLDILRACDAGDVISTVPGVTPGCEILLRLDGWPRVTRALGVIADIEARGIAPAMVAPDWWRHLHNRISGKRIASGLHPRSACGVAAPSQSNGMMPDTSLFVLSGLGVGLAIASLFVQPRPILVWNATASAPRALYCIAPPT